VCGLSASAGQAIVLFGGTFDPVHFGHLRTAVEVRDVLNVQDFRFLPSGNPPHRVNEVTDSLHRLAMLRIALTGIAGFTVDERELKRAGPSYMVDTLQEIRLESTACKNGIAGQIFSA
jgi:nicotinate-nucleotide adenylyltransferase